MELINFAICNFLVLVTFHSLPFCGAGVIPFGLASLSSSGDSVALPLKGKDLRRDWCIGRSMVRKVHHHGCNSTEVKTKLCFGQCTTFFIPKNRFSSFSSCTQCTPSKIEKIEVKLKCLGGVTKKKRVHVVKRCGCRSCDYAQFYLRRMRTDFPI